MDYDVRDELISKLLARFDERQQLLEEAALTDAERVEIDGLLATADAVWIAAHQAPPLAEDPIAAMLGLIPNADCRLDGRQLAQARKTAGLTVSQLATRLVARGWKVTPNEVFQWETRNADQVAPAVVEALSHILGRPVERLIAASPVGTVDELSEVRKHPRFAQLVARWAQLQRVSLASAASMLESRALATVYRGEHPEPDQVLSSLEVLVDAVEAGSAE